VTAATYSAKVGTFYLGCENVLLFLNNTQGGAFGLAPRDGSQGFIEVGHYCGANWPHTLAVLTHELMEYAMARHNCRFLPEPSVSRSHAAYTFHMTHEQFAEVSEQVGLYLAYCLPALKRHFDAVVKLAKTEKNKR